MTELRPFGRTGVRISALTLGAMNFGVRANPDHDEGVRIIHRALDAGVTSIDTADVYSNGESERIVGKALQGRRDDVFLATKFFGQMGEGNDPNQRGGSRRWIMREVEDSLRRLGTDHIDLYQMHRPDLEIRFEESLGALTDLVRQGKVRYIGTSTFPAWSIVEGQWISERRGLERVVSEQPPYSILVRAVEREVLPVAQRYDMAVIPWSPLAGGYLTDSDVSQRVQRLPERYDRELPANVGKVEAVAKLRTLAAESGITLIHLALAFVLRHPAVTSAIIGPRTIEHLESALGADKVVLSADVLDRIDEIVPPGTNLNPADAGWHPPSVTDPAQRRRP